MSNLTLNRHFYKTINFWLGVLFAIVDVSSIVQRGYVSYDATFDIIGIILSLGLILSALIKKNDHAGNKRNGTA